MSCACEYEHGQHKTADATSASNVVVVLLVEHAKFDFTYGS